MLLFLVFVFALVHSGDSTKKFDVSWRVVFRTIGFKTAGKSGNASLQIIGRGSTNTKYYDLTVGQGVTSHTIITNYFGELTHVKVFFKGGNNTWNLQQVEISRTDDVYNKHIFHCWCWVNVTSTKTLPVSNPMWLMTVFTSKRTRMYTDRVWLKITGTQGVSRTIYIDEMNFRPGSKVTNVKYTKIIGIPKKIQVGHKILKGERNEMYHLDKIEIKRGEILSKSKYVFNCKCAIHEYQTKTVHRSSLQECTDDCTSCYTDPRWRVSVKTADYNKDSGTDDEVLIVLIGTEGNSSAIGLDNPNHNDFERNAWDHFVISTTVIGEIKGVAFAMFGKDEWSLLQVQVELMGSFDKILVFDYGGTLKTNYVYLHL